MPKRPLPWQLDKQRTAKGLRECAPCDTPGCKNLGMGWYGIYTPRSLWLCVYCAARAQRAQRADAPRES